MNKLKFIYAESLYYLTFFIVIFFAIIFGSLSFIFDHLHKCIDWMMDLFHDGVSKITDHYYDIHNSIKRKEL